MTQVISTASLVGQRRFTVDEFHRMVDAGILDEHDRVELLDGRVLQMPPIGPEHGSHVDWLNDLRPQVIVRVQGPAVLDEFWQPQPDVMLLKRKANYYKSGHPNPRDVLLLIEVCDSSIERDRDLKVPAYAESGVQDVWLVNVPKRIVEVYRKPSGHSFELVERHGRRDTIAPLSFPDHPLNIDDLFSLRV